MARNSEVAPLLGNKSSELFEMYEKEYVDLSADISNQLRSASRKSGESKKATLQAIAKKLDIAEQNVRNMETETYSVPSNVREQLKVRLNNYKRDLAKLKQDHERENKSGGRADLLSGRGGLDGGLDDDENMSNQQRQRVLQSTSKLNDTSARLDHIMRLNAENEQMGADVLNNLQLQREQIIRSKENLDATNTSLTRSNRTIGRMMRRVITNKIIIAIIILVLLAAIGLILYFKLRPSHNNPNPNNTTMLYTQSQQYYNQYQ